MRSYRYLLEWHRCATFKKRWMNGQREPEVAG